MLMARLHHRAMYVDRRMKTLGATRLLVQRFMTGLSSIRNVREIAFVLGISKGAIELIVLVFCSVDPVVSCVLKVVMLTNGYKDSHHVANLAASGSGGPQ